MDLYKMARQVGIQKAKQYSNSQLTKMIGVRSLECDDFDLLCSGLKPHRVGWTNTTQSILIANKENVVDIINTSTPLSVKTKLLGKYETVKKDLPLKHVQGCFYELKLIKRVCEFLGNYKSTKWYTNEGFLIGVNFNRVAIVASRL